MIPTVLAIALAVGRWWVVVVAAVAWPALLLATDVMGFEADLLGAAGLGAVNAAVGVAVHRGIATLVRFTRRLIAAANNLRRGR